MHVSDEQVLAWFHEREKDSSSVIEAMRDVRDISNGDITVPMPEVDKTEQPAVANLIAEGIDQISMRVASRAPNLFCPAVNPRKETGVRSREYSEIRRMAILGWWQFNKMQRIHRRKARFLAAYGAAPTVIRPDFKNKVPRWQVRDPLGTYPSHTENYDDDAPGDVIFAFKKPLRWLKDMYPEAARSLWKGYDPSPSDMFQILEYVDCDEIIMVAVGAPNLESSSGQGYVHADGTMPVVNLERMVNRAGICTAVTPKRITLDRVMGQFNQLTGMYQAQAKLMALELIAVEKAVFPDMALIPNGPNVTPKLTAGRWIDGREGKINVIQNGQIQVVNQPINPASFQMQDRLEQHQRKGGAGPSSFSGEAPSNSRTGRSQEIITGEAVDFRIQEYQEQLAEALVQENERAILVAKAYFGRAKKTFYIMMKNAVGPVDYVPNEHFETTDTRVSYSMPGMDVNNAAVALGQRVGLGSMSRRSMMYHDPMVDDPEHEHDQILSEGLELATLTGIQQLASQGQIPPSDIAAIAMKVTEENKSLYVAIQEAQEEAQERQAEQVPADDPAAQPGIAVPGTGAESQGQIPQPPDDLSQVQQLLMGLRQPETASAGGTGPAPAPVSA
ncbi:MAG: hypothetical protein H0W51_08630 [Euzebyales bacterium]|nr:hypothetical protein [Euzebyales bacterium]